MKKVTIKVQLVLVDWRDRRDITKSVYHTRTGVELSMGSFHNGSTFEGAIEVNEQEAEFLRSAMKDSFSPVFAVLDPSSKNWRWV